MFKALKLLLNIFVGMYIYILKTKNGKTDRESFVSGPAYCNVLYFPAKHFKNKPQKGFEQLIINSVQKKYLKNILYAL